jgi:hypothetical protein
MNAETTTCAAPLAVWHADRYWGRWKHMPEASQWARDHGWPVNDLYRIEFWLIDVPFARLFAFARNDKGKIYDSETHSPAVCAPVNVILDALPPEHLRVMC